MEGCDVITAVGRFIKDVGFPVAVAVWFAVRLDPLIRKNTEALHALRRGLTEYGIGSRGSAPGRPPNRPEEA